MSGTRTEGTLARPDGVVLAYEDTRPSHAEERAPEADELRGTVVLTHGFTVTLRMWDPTVAALVGAGWRVITWDVRGHGPTVTPLRPELFTLDHVVADLVALLDHLGLPRVVLGGLSFGGFLSLAAWAAAPERIAALLLADTGPGFRNPTARDAWNRTARARADAIAAGGLEAVRSGDATGGGGIEAQLGLGRHVSFDALACAVRGFLAQEDSRAMDVLDTIDVPTLILVGALDEPFLRASDVMSARIPGAELVVIPDAGHIANLDQPEAFQAAVLGFLDQL